MLFLRKPIKFLILTILLSSMSFSTANALNIISYSRNYYHSLSTSGHPTASAVKVTPELVDPFDPNLGTLADIDINFYGSVEFTLNAGSNIFITGQQGETTPIPYSLMAQLDISVEGYNGYYEFLSPLQLNYTMGNISGIGGQTVVGGGSYSFDFRYNEIINQFGGPLNAASSSGLGLLPPSLLSGQLDDFIEDINLLDQLKFTYELSFLSLASGNITTSSTLTAISDMQVTTNYTYTLPDPISEPVPEPTTIFLLGTGLIGLVGFGRKKFKKN